MASYEFALEPELREVPRLLDWIAQCCGRDGVPGATASRFQLAVEEAVVNIIDHAFVGAPPPHLFRLRLEIDRRRIAAELVDNGNAFDPSLAPTPDCALPVERRSLGGLGIHLMRNMAERVEYRRYGGCNHLRLESARPVSA